MGYLKHRSVIITSSFNEDIVEAHKAAMDLLNGKSSPFDDKASKLISSILEGLVNSQYSFFIAPDGSKEGWDTSNSVDKMTEKFIEWLNNYNETKGGNFIDFAYLEFGGDDDEVQVLASSKE